MQKVEIVGTFDSADSAAEVARALNAWFQWVMDPDDADIGDIFEDFGITSEDYAFDRSDIDWEEMPVAKARGNHVIIVAYTAETQDILQELIESLGAFEVEQSDDDDN